MEIWKTLKILLPTICICMPFFQLKPMAIAQHRESFGNHELFLDLYLETNPEGYFQKGKSQNLRFTGYLVHENKQEVVQGRRIDSHGDRFYLFETAHGPFHGRLSPGTSGCEPVLHYNYSGAVATPTRGSMKGAFCASHTSSM